MFSGGSGTKQDPFLIGSVEDLEAMVAYDSPETASFYKQICDIDFNWAVWNNPNWFYSAYDGSNYKIMNVNVANSIYASFFGAIGSQGNLGEDHVFRDIRIVNIKIDYCEYYVAGFSGLVAGAKKIINCHVENVEITGAKWYSAGFIGPIAYGYGTIVENCTVSGKGTFENGAGFCVSSAHDSVIRNCKSHMDCIDCIGTYDTVAGFSTWTYGIVEKCYASGTLNMTTTGASSGGAAAFAAYIYGTVRQCATDVKIESASRACSGFANVIDEDAVMEDCYGKGDINVTMDSFLNGVIVAGLVQRIIDKNATIKRCYYLGNIKVTSPESTGDNYENSFVFGGLVGAINYSPELTTIKNCFSIMQSLTFVNRTGTPTENIKRIGRIWGANTSITTDAHNYALNTATYNGSTTFPEQDKTLEGKDGQDITITELRKKETYEAEGWDFENVWDIHTDYNDGFPYLRCFGLYASTESKATVKVYDSDFKQGIGSLKAVISNAYNDNITDEINGSYTMEFSTVIDGEKSQYLETGNICEVQNEYFRIVYIEESRNEDGTLTIDVQCEHVNYDLLHEDYHMEYYTADGTAFDMLVSLFEETPFNVGDIDEEFQVVKTISSQEPLYKREALFLIAAAYEAEVQFNKFTVSLVKRRGGNKGFYFAYSKNIKGVTRVVNARKRINGQPIVSYSLSAVMLEKLLGADESFETGDTVKVYDAGLGVNIETRIVKTSKGFMEEIDGDVEIGNFIPDFIDSVNQIERSTVHKGKVYNGIKISPEDGFVAERSDKMARNTMNATFGNKLELGDGEGNYEPVFYVTIEQGEAKLNLKGNAEFTGKVLASLISASDIKGGSIEIGDNMFTVDNTGHMVANSAYIKGLIEASEFIGGKIIITNEAETERVILSVSDGFRFQAWDDNAGEEGEWIDSIWMEDGKGKFFGEIISSTITGGLIRTAETGRRVEISDNQIRSYNDSEELHGLVTNNTSNNFGDWEFYNKGELIFTIYNAEDAISLIPSDEVPFVVGSERAPLNLRGSYIRINGNLVPTLPSKTAAATYGENEQQMLQEVYDKMKQLLDAINNN